MKLSELDRQQLEFLAERVPHWMTEYRPYQMLENHYEWVVKNHPFSLCNPEKKRMMSDIPDSILTLLKENDLLEM